jgi:hypothetical protein
LAACGWCFALALRAPHIAPSRCFAPPPLTRRRHASGRMAEREGLAHSVRALGLRHNRRPHIPPPSRFAVQPRFVRPWASVGCPPSRWLRRGMLSHRESMAEREGFEPPGPCGPAVFKTAAIDHSATSPWAFSTEAFSAVACRSATTKRFNRAGRWWVRSRTAMPYGDVRRSGTPRHAPVAVRQQSHAFPGRTTRARRRRAKSRARGRD